MWTLEAPAMSRARANRCTVIRIEPSSLLSVHFILSAQKQVANRLLQARFHFRQQAIGEGEELGRVKRALARPFLHLHPATAALAGPVLRLGTVKFGKHGAARIERGLEILGGEPVGSRHAGA